MRKVINTNCVLCVIIVYLCNTDSFLSGLPLQDKVPNSDKSISQLQCPTQLDVAFAIDASYSVGPYFYELLDLVKTFSAMVNVFNDGFRISVTQFSSDATVELSLSNGTSMDVINRTLDSIRYRAGRTETGLALRTIREQVFGTQIGNRGDVEDLLILITDGSASDHHEFIVESDNLRQSGASVFAVSLGFLTDLQELRAIAGQNIFFSSSQHIDIANLSDSIVTSLCDSFGWIPSTTETPQFNTEKTEEPYRMSYERSNNLTTNNTDKQSDMTTVSTTEFSSLSTAFGLSSSTTMRPQSNTERTFEKQIPSERRNISTTNTTNKQSESETMPPKNSSIMDCQITRAVDVVFLVDSSKNLNHSEFSNIRSFLQTFLENYLTESSSLHRVGIIQYSDDAIKVLPMGFVNSTQGFHDALDALRYKGGNSNLASALNVLESEVLTTHRPGVPRIGVVVTAGGFSAHSNLARLHAQILHHNDVHVFVIGVGEQVSQDELRVLASEPKDDHIFMVQNLTEDNNNATSKTAASLCFATTQTMDEPECVDTLPNCSDYGETVCQDPSYQQWTEKHCSKYCHKCDYNRDKEITAVESYKKTHSNSTSDSDMTNSTGTCEDLLPDCDNYGGLSVCDSFTAWAGVRCRKYCGFCSNTRPERPKEMPNFRCPSWVLPTECSLQKVQWSQCLMPSCPEGYVLTVMPQG